MFPSSSTTQIHKVSFVSVHVGQQSWRRIDLKSADLAIFYRSLVVTNKIISQPLQMKFGLRKQFVKILPSEGDGFKYLIF